MALANIIATKGYSPERIDTTAYVTLEKGESGFGISTIKLECTAIVPGIDPATFQELAQDAKKNCPVSKALAAVTILLETELVN